MKKNIAVIKGDGIGPEIVAEALKILDKICKKFGHKFTYIDVLMGGIAVDTCGIPLPLETITKCKSSDSVLLGAVGGKKWDNLAGNLRPEAGLLGLRHELGVFSNIRPAKLYPQLKDACPLKEIITKDGIDLVIVRELIGGAYFGKRATSVSKDGVESAFDTMAYSDFEIERIVRAAFDMARNRRGIVHSVDKANVLDSSRLWRKIAHEVAKDYQDIQIIDILVDNCAMQLIKNPRQFDVIVTENLFGDILSDEASMITGSLGMIPSASLGMGGFGIFEPIHGSAPDIAGQDLANPIATILSIAMMLELSFGLVDEAKSVENAVNIALSDGFRTMDIMSEGMKTVGCVEMGDIICGNI